MLVESVSTSIDRFEWVHIALTLRRSGARLLVNDTEGFSDSVFRTFSTACDIRVESSYNGADDEAVRNLEAVGGEYRPVAPQERQDHG